MGLLSLNRSKSWNNQKNLKCRLWRCGQVSNYCDHLFEFYKVVVYEIWNTGTTGSYVRLINRTEVTTVVGIDLCSQFSELCFYFSERITGERRLLLSRESTERSHVQLSYTSVNRGLLCISNTRRLLLYMYNELDKANDSVYCILRDCNDDGTTRVQDKNEITSCAVARRLMMTMPSAPWDRH